MNSSLQNLQEILDGSKNKTKQNKKQSHAVFFVLSRSGCRNHNFATDGFDAKQPDKPATRRLLAYRLRKIREVFQNQNLPTLLAEREANELE